MEKSITKSKIICTLGPSSNTFKQIKKLADIGMDCARINFSHGNHKEKAELFKTIRKADDTIAILCDIQGPKIRIGEIQEGGAFLHIGGKLIITSDEIVGNEKKITTSYKKLIKEVKKDDLIYINDGLICLKVDKIKNGDVVCKILAGGTITSRKGVNLPITDISLRVPTKKDIEDLKFIADLNPEFIAVSFVKDSNDVLTVKKYLKKFGNENIKVISKIERPVAISNFDSILKVSDGIMVARGDLGVEIPPEHVIPVQKELVIKCNIAGKPVIVATQMLESMVKAPIPTRAEVSDVYNAIEDGADAVMLSAETASGKYPEKTVEIMERTIRISETNSFKKRNVVDFEPEKGTFPEIVGQLVFVSCKKFCEMGHGNGKIICLTTSGYSGQTISKYRPHLPIIGITSNKRTAREMKITWGIEPFYFFEFNDNEILLDKIIISVKKCFEKKLINRNDKLIITGNMFNLKSQTNMVTIFSADDILDL